MNYCWQCCHCALTRPNQIHPEGRFYCNAYKIWRNGDEMERDRCKGFYMKNCKVCKHQNTKLCVEGHGEYCRNFCHVDLVHKERLFQGRTYKTTNKDALEAEHEFDEYIKRRINHIKRKAIDKDALRFSIGERIFENECYQGDYQYTLDAILKLADITYRELPRYIWQRIPAVLDSNDILRPIQLVSPEYTVEEFTTETKNRQPRKRYRIVKVWDEVDNVKESE